MRQRKNLIVNDAKTLAFDFVIVYNPEFSSTTVRKRKKTAQKVAPERTLRAVFKLN